MFLGTASGVSRPKCGLSGSRGEGPPGAANGVCALSRSRKVGLMKGSNKVAKNFSHNFLQ